MFSLYMLTMKAVMTTTSTQSSTSTWHAPCSILYVETWCWAAGGITVLEIASSWLLTTLMHLFTSSKLATVWSPSSYEAWSSGVNGFNIILSHWCHCSLSSLWLSHFLRYLLSAAGGGGRHRGCREGWFLLLLWAGPFAPCAVLQCCF